MNKKILIFTSALNGGGAEKHTVRILPYLKEHFETHLALCRIEGPFVSEVPPEVMIHEIGGHRALRSIFPLVKVIKKLKPHLVLSIQVQANLAAALAVSLIPAKIRPKLILNTQNTLSIHLQSTKSLKNSIILKLISILYPIADGVIAISKGVSQDLLTINPSLKSTIIVIYNSGLDDLIPKLMYEKKYTVDLPDPTTPMIIACGRLVQQKGYIFLLKAFALVIQKVKANLVILGEGPEQEKLINLSIKLGIQNNVFFLGFQSNPYQYMRKASVFVLSSLWEGFGNVIVEGMACGIPVIATNCPSGPGEIIKNGDNGILIPPADVDSLYQSILTVLTDKKLAKRLKEGGSQRCQDFHVKKIAQEYIDYLKLQIEK